MKITEVLKGYTAAAKLLKRAIGAVVLNRASASDIFDIAEDLVDAQKVIPLSIMKRIKMNEMTRHLGHRPSANEVEIYRHEELMYYDQYGIGDLFTDATAVLHRALLKEAANWELGGIN